MAKAGDEDKLSLEYLYESSLNVDQDLDAQILHVSKDFCKFKNPTRIIGNFPEMINRCRLLILVFSFM